MMGLSKRLLNAGMGGIEEPMKGGPIAEISFGTTGIAWVTQTGVKSRRRSIFDGMNNNTTKTAFLTATGL